MHLRPAKAGWQAGPKRERSQGLSGTSLIGVHLSKDPAQSTVLTLRKMDVRNSVARLRLSNRVIALLKNQSGRCWHCGLRFVSDDHSEPHHIRLSILRHGNRYRFVKPADSVGKKLLIFTFIYREYFSPFCLGQYELFEKPTIFLVKLVQTGSQLASPVWVVLIIITGKGQPTPNSFVMDWNGFLLRQPG